MKKEQDFIISFSWIAMIAYFIVVPLFSSNTLATLIWVPTILLNFIFCIIKIEKISVKVTTISGVLVAIMLISMFFADKLFSREHYISMVCLINSFLSISYFSTATISRKTREFIKHCVVLVALLFTLYSFTNIVYKVTEDGVSRMSPYFTFNLGNANMAGIFLFLIFSILFIYTFAARTLVKKVGFIALDAYLVYMIYRTGARSCMIGVIALVAVGIWYGSKRINKFIIYAATIFPVVFIFLLTKLYNNGYEDVEILGKSIFTGREVYFQECLDSIDTLSKWIFGDFAEKCLNNAHNAALAWLLSLGVIGVILIYVIYYDVIFTINDDSNKARMKNVCVACILCLFVESIAEATLFLGGFPGIVFVNTMIVLSKESTEAHIERGEFGIEETRYQQG